MLGGLTTALFFYWWFQSVQIDWHQLLRWDRFLRVFCMCLICFLINLDIFLQRRRKRFISPLIRISMRLWSNAQTSLLFIFPPHIWRRRIRIILNCRITNCWPRILTLALLIDLVMIYLILKTYWRFDREFAFFILRSIHCDSALRSKWSEWCHVFIIILEFLPGFRLRYFSNVNSCILACTIGARD